jgi:hypothetical protein
VHGLPPRPGQLPEPVRSGYLSPSQDESARQHAEAPELLPAASWYYRG